jgi:hypothetical protein
MNFEGIRLTRPNKADLLFHSVFGKTYLRSPGKKILYTGENIPFSNFNSDFALSFEESTDDLKNFRLPLWMLQIKWFKKQNYGNPNLLCELQKLMEPTLNVDKRTNFITGIFNHDIQGNRLSAMAKLIRFGNAKFYGKPFGNHFFGEEMKIKILKESKFNLCFENSNTYGYHTEKLIHAKMAGCIAIYWANQKSAFNDFNKKSFLFIENPNDESQFERLIEEMLSKTSIDNVRNEPLFNSIPKIDPVVNYFYKIFRNLS